MERLITPIEIYNKLLDFMKKEKIDPREMALACKIYESIYEEQFKPIIKTTDNKFYSLSDFVEDVSRLSSSKIDFSELYTRWLV